MKSDLMKMNVQDFCRICLRSDKTLFGLFDSITPDIDSTSSDVFAVWKTFVRILKSTDDTISLPERICQVCRNEILGAYSFAKKCEKAKTICAQMKCVTVRLTKLKSLPSKNSLFNKNMTRKPFKKNKVRQFHIPLKAVKWVYNFDPLKRPKHNGLHEETIALEDDSEIGPPILEDNSQEMTFLKDNDNSLTERSSFKCEICQQTFAMKISYNRHIRTHSRQKGSIVCPVCNARFSSQSVYEVHSFMHSVTKKRSLNTFNCTQCSRKLSTQMAFDAHMRSHDVEKKKDKMMDEHRCDICNKLFHNARALSSHRHRHAKRNKCSICSKSFMTKAQLVNHLAHHKVMKPFACNVCKKAFSDKLSLKAHQKSHKDEHVSEICSLCGESFDDKEQYTLHIETHESKDCSSSFNENINHRNEPRTLINNLDIPQSKFQYGCDICDARFPKHVELIRHKQIHSKDSSHVCEICEQKFNLAYALKLHMRIHSDGKQLDCGLCGESFENDTDLCEHMKIHRSLSVTGEAGSQELKPFNGKDSNDNSKANAIASETEASTQCALQRLF